MIPKIIHYCWFGGNPLPDLVRKCIASWEKYCPDYTIMRWDESNFDVNCCDYVREAYEAKKWAFVSDYVRLYALVNVGGIYMDTDVEVIRPLDSLLSYEAVSGHDTETRIQSAVMACRKEHPLFQEFLRDYDGRHFLHADGSYDLTVNVDSITKICQKYGFQGNNQKQTICGFTLLPQDYLCPKDVWSRKVNITQNTLTLHHFDGSWRKDETRYAYAVAERYKIPGVFYVARLIGEVKYHGFKGLAELITRKIGEIFSRK